MSNILNDDVIQRKCMVYLSRESTASAQEYECFEGNDYVLWVQ